ncbi:MAG: hypothetical protein ABIY50_06515 [Ignavibacteria bacterium]
MIKIIFTGLILIVQTIFIAGCKDTTIQSTDPIAEYTQIDFEPSVSNDGNNLLYVHSDLNYELSGIYNINFSQGTDTQFISGLARSPDWSPDSRWIVYNLDNLIFKIRSDGDSNKILVNEGKNFFPKWSNDGSRIAYANTDCRGIVNCGVWIMDNNGENKTLIDSGANYPEWVDDGNTLIYFKSIINETGNSTGDSIFQYSLNNNTRSFIADLNGADHKINFYLNNNSAGEFVFCSTSQQGYTYVYKRISNGLIIKLTNTQGWSPNIFQNNNKIYYTNRDPGNGRLWFMNSDGSNPQQLNY